MLGDFTKNFRPYQFWLKSDQKITEMSHEDPMPFCFSSANTYSTDRHFENNCRK